MEGERKDYWAAFAIGAVLGVGATLLLKPDADSAKRILYEIEPALHKARKRGGRLAQRHMKKAKRALRRYR